MKVEQGSVLEHVLNRQKVEADSMRAAGLGDFATIVDNFGNINVKTTPKGEKTVQFGKKATPIRVS